MVHLLQYRWICVCVAGTELLQCAARFTRGCCTPNFWNVENKNINAVHIVIVDFSEIGGKNII